MDLQSIGAYLVVKILSKTCNDGGKYGCILKSWVKVKDSFDNTVVFGYPSEDRIDIKIRVIESQPLDMTWPTIFGEVVFHSDSQDEAFRFLDTKTEHESDTQDQSENTSKQDNTEVKVTKSIAVTEKSIDQPKRKRGRPRKRKLSDQEDLSQNETKEDKLDKELELQIIEAEKLISTYASDIDDEEAAICSTPNSSHNVKTPDTTQTLPTESPVNKQVAKEITTNRKSRHEKRILSKGCQGYSNEDFVTSDDSDCAPKTIHRKLPRTSGQSVENQDQEINTNLLNDQVYSECYNFYVELNDSYQKSMSILDSAEDYLQNVISAHKDNVAAKTKEQSSLPTSQQADAINADKFYHPQPLLQERRTSSVSEEDTRWTIRYPEPRSDLIELLPNTVSSYRDTKSLATRTIPPS